MIILYWMTPDPVVTTEDQSLLDTLRLMREKSVRRLPVVRDGDELCGIISGPDLLRVVPAMKKLTEDEYSEEASRALAEHTVADAMVPDPHTCKAHDRLEEVAERMRQLKIGALPVMRRGHLVGIISEHDIMRALVELSYHGAEGKRITLRIPLLQKIDVMYNIVDLSRRCGLEILTVLTHPILDESALMATLRVKGEKVDDFVKSLWEAGYKVADVS